MTTRTELINIFEYNYGKIGLTDTLYKMMKSLSKVHHISGKDKKILIIEIITVIVGAELTKFVDDLIEYIYKKEFVKGGLRSQLGCFRPFFKCKLITVIRKPKARTHV